MLGQSADKPFNEGRLGWVLSFKEGVAELACLYGFSKVRPEKSNTAGQTSSGTHNSIRYYFRETL